MTASHDYTVGVRRALATAGLYVAGVAPLVQFAMFHDSTPGYPDRGLVWAAFAVHAVIWGCAVLRWLPAVLMLISWAAIGIVIAVQTASAGIAEPAAPRNIAMTIAATAALLLPLRRAVAATVAVSLASSAALVLAAPQPTMPLWSMAAQIPVYALGVAVASALAFRELQHVARAADEAARARLEVDRTVRRKELAAEASRHRARMMHDTIVNTLGAIANARIAAAAPLVAHRCAEDARMVDVLRRGATPVDPAVRDVFAHAREIDVDLIGENADLLQDRLAADESWRRREIISALKETVTNVAKHAGVAEARIAYEATTFTVTVTDEGAGMGDTEPLARSLSARARDAQSEMGVVSHPGGGTAVRLRIAPLRDTASRVFEDAAARMATAIAAVMLTQFAALSVLTLTFQPDWTVSEAIAPTATWLVIAAVFALILTGAGRSRLLPVRVVVACYLGIVAMAVIYNVTKSPDSVCGLHPQLAWIGDAVATICVVLVLVDGRIRVVLPAVLLTTVGVVLSLLDVHADCRGVTLGLVGTDILVIGAFYILRRRTMALSKIVAAQHADLIRRREEQERLAVEVALSDDGFDTTLEHAKSILRAVAERPDRIHDPRIRAAAGLEEGYLRALIGLTADVGTARTKQRFVGSIDAARAAGVKVAVHAEPGVLNEDSAGFVVTTVGHIIGRCAAGDELSIGVFGPATEPTLIIVAPPHILSGYPDDSEAQTADITVAAELGLVEVRGFGGASCDSG